MNHRSHIILIITTVSFILGVIAGEFSSYSTILFSFIFLLFILHLILFFILFFINKIKKERNNFFDFVPIFVMTASLFFSLGILRMQFVEEKQKLICEKVCELEGVVISVPKRDEMSQSFSLRVLDKEKYRNDVYDILVKVSLYPHYYKYDRVKIFGVIKEPVNNHLTNKFFDYENYLNIQKIGSVSFFPSIEKVGKYEGNSFLDKIIFYSSSLKDRLVSSLHKYISRPASSLAEGMIFGNSIMSKDILESFRVSGLSHIVVLSGFNIAILIAFVFAFLFFLPIFIRGIFSFLLVLIFVVTVSPEPSVIRATIMSFGVLTALMLGRGHNSKQILFLSLFIISFIFPKSLIYDASFHLSFLATFGIVYLSEILNNIFSNLFVFLRNILIATLSAYIATLPYIIYTFGTISVYSLFTNILVIPFVPILMLSSFLVTVFSFFSKTLSLFFGFVSSLLGDFIIFVAKFFESLPFSSVLFTSSFFVMFIFYFFIFIFFLLIFHFYKNKNETIETKDSILESGIITY